MVSVFFGVLDAQRQAREAAPGSIPLILHWFPACQSFHAFVGRVHIVSMSRFSSLCASLVSAGHDVEAGEQRGDEVGIGRGGGRSGGSALSLSRR